PSLDPLEIDTSLVWKRIRETQDRIAATDDNPDRFRALGADVFLGPARLVGPRAVEVDGRVLDTRYVLICTGSRPATPPVAGLAEAGYLTSENVFELERASRSVVAIGGGPIAIELAQGLTRLGVRVTVLQKGSGILTRDEPELVAMLTRRLEEEGVDLQFDVEVERVTVEEGQKVVHANQHGRELRFGAEELLVGVGRKPNVDGLGLDDVGVKVGKRGIEVDGRMRTNVPSIYASGDVVGRYLFTHSAGHEAVRAVRDMFFPGKGTVGDLVPWCTFTDPELAHAGLTEAQARELHGDRVQVRRLDMDHSDRARADGDSEGRIKVVSGPGDRLLGAHVLAANAGEMIHELAYVVSRKGRLTDLSKLIHVYPTRSTSIGQLAAESTFDRAKRLRWLTRLTRLAHAIAPREKTRR
ncbi:MAG: FAD-dependent oxidoreductase, partial [Actinomycetota bacterium]|nr:FAD-dependent oxidoreductase [Actinomycetota bacterium]